MPIFETIKQKIFFLRRPDDNFSTWISRGIMAVSFLMPFFVFAPQALPLEQTKAFFFLLLIFILTVVVVISSIINKKLAFIKNSIGWPILTFICFYLISTIFSRSHYASLVGYGGFYGSSLLVMVALALFFFLIINYFKSPDDQKKLLLAFIVGVDVAMLFFLLQSVGFSLLPGDLGEPGYNLSAGATNILAILAVVNLFIALGLSLNSAARIKKIIGWASVALMFCTVIVVGQSVPYYLLLSICFLAVVYLAIKMPKRLGAMLAFTGILTLASIMLLIGPINYFQKHLPVPVSLDLASSFSVAKEAVWERPFWGTGPQALVEAISRHRPDSFFSSTIWNLRFIKVGNEWLTLLASLGLGGWLAFIWLIISFIRKIWPAISRATDGDEDFSVRLGIILAWLALTGASFFIPFSLILYFAWWLLFSLALSSVFVWSKNNNPIEIDLLRSRPVLLVTLFSGAIILITLVVVGFFGQRFIRAGLIFFRAQQSIIAQQDAAPILSDMRQAAALNPYEPQYQISLAQGYGAQALLLSGQATPDQTQIQAQTQKVIDSLNEAKKLSVLSAYVYEQEAAVYQSLFSLISNADQLAAEAYANALLIEPNNPLLLLNLGRAKLFEAQVIKKDDSQNSQAAGLVDEAVSSLTRALAIKKDLPIIQLSLSAAYLEKGDYEAAKTNLDQLIAANANDRDARWLLANVYEQQSLFDLALAELEILKAQQPENQTILDKIKEVEGKKMVPAEQ